MKAAESRVQSVHLISLDFSLNFEVLSKALGVFFYSSTCSSLPPEGPPAPHTYTSIISTDSFDGYP